MTFCDGVLVDESGRCFCMILGQASFLPPHVAIPFTHLYRLFVYVCMRVRGFFSLSEIK